MSVLNKIGNWLFENGHTLLSIGSGIGTAATMIFAGQAAVKASQVIEECEEDGHEMTKQEYVEKIFPIYAKPAICFAITEACNFGAWKMSSKTIEELKKREAILIGTNVIMSSALAKCRPHMDPEVYEEIIDQARDEMEELDDGNRIFRFEFYPNPIERTKIQMLECFLEVNRMISEEGQCSIDDVCDILDIPKILYPEDKNGRPEFCPGSLYGWGRNELEYYKGNSYVNFMIATKPVVDEDTGLEFYDIYVDIQPQFNYDMPLSYGARNFQNL